MEESQWKRWFTPRKVVFHVLFQGFHAGLFALGWILQQEQIRLSALNTLQFSVWISRGAGLVLSVDTLIILLPMCRTMLRYIRPKVRFIPLDESQWFHRQVAYTMLIYVIAHVAAHYVNFFNVEKSGVRPDLAVQIHYAQVGGVSGHIMLLCMLLMYTTAHAKIRQQSYETFWYTHHLFIPFLLGMYTHATGCFVRDSVLPMSPLAGSKFWTHCIGYEGWRWELFGGGIYLFERLYREVRARRSTEIVKVVRHPYDAVEIQFKKPSMKYKSGQWLFINCPDVSHWQWHPFTITSCPYDPYISIHIRQVGDFTRAFADAVGAGQAQSKMYDDMDPNGMYEIALQHGQKMPRIRIDGPYGAPAEDVFNNEIAVLIGTGIGVTPWAAILKNIWHMRNSPNPPKRLRRIEFFWICRDTSSFEWFQALLSSLEQQSLGTGPQGQDFLRIHVYLTAKLDTDTANNLMLNSVGQEKDPLTELSSRTNYGRPQWNKLMNAMRDGILDRSYITGMEGTLQTRIGVFYCGPSTAARQIKKATQDASCQDVKFSFFKEHF